MTSKAKKQKRQLAVVQGHMRPSWWRGSWGSSEFPAAERRRRRAAQKRAKASKKRNRQ